MINGSSATGRILVIGMEMGDGKLIRRWIDDGQLPVMKELLDGGQWAWLETTADVLHVSAWPSLYTGADPAQHGVYYTFQPRRGLQGYTRFAAGTYGEPSFWKLIGDSGKQCVVFDAPYTEPEPGFQGTQIFDWGTWAQYLGTRSTPPQLVKSLEQNCGNYPLGLEAHDIGLVGWDPEDMRERLIRSVAAKGRASSWLLAQENWDLFFTVFGETHPAAHYCWPDDSDDGSDAPQLLAIYQAIDAAIGEILAAAGSDVSVFVVSGDGVGPNRSGWHLLPDVLKKLGYFVTADPDHAAPETEPSSRRFDPVKALRDLIPKDLRKAIARRLPTTLRDKLAQRVDTADIDWGRTRAYCLPTDLEGYIRINLAGREPAGVVEPGAEYSAVCNELAAALKELRNPATGESAVSDVIITAERMTGPRQDQLPDIIVRWSDEAKITSLESAAIGTVSGESPDGRTGTHKPPGFVLARTASGRSIRIPESAHVFDIAPTLLANFGIDKTPTMQGATWPMATKN